MANPFTEKDRMSIPSNLDECSIVDSTTRELWRIAQTVEAWGLFILIGIIVLGLVSSVIINDFANSITREDSFATFLSSAAVWAIIAIVEYAAYHLISLLIRALASIVQNTKVSAKVALYNASLNTASVAPVNKTAKHIPPAPEPDPVPRRVNIERNCNYSNADAIHPNYTDAGEIVCPKCGTKQRADRNVCWTCNQ